MTILFVSGNFRLFGSLDSGAANRSNMFIKALSQIGDVDVISFYEEPQQSDIPNCRVVWDKGIPYKKGLVQKITEKIYLLLYPSSPKGYYSFIKQRALIVSQQYEKKHYDIVACRYIKDAVSCGLLKYSDRLVIDVDDHLKSASLRNMSNLKDKHFWSRSLAIWVSNHISMMQERLLSRVMCSFYSNKSEPTYRESVYLHNVSSQIKILPCVTENTPMRLLIVAWLDYFPNKNGVLHFVKNVFPLIKKDNPRVELHIAGKTKDQELLRQLNTIDGVSVLGYVEDILEEYRNCRAVVVPIYEGAGTSIKFIEGIMMNRPVLSTPMGVRGFENLCIPGEHYMLAETDEEFAEKAAFILRFIDNANMMAQKAIKVGRDNFSQEKFYETVKNTIMSRYIEL